MHFQTALCKEEAQIGIFGEKRNICFKGNRESVCAVPGKCPICCTQAEKGDWNLRYLTLRRAGGKGHSVFSHSFYIEAKAMVCPFIGADVFQIDREISVEFIEFHGGFVNIRFICGRLIISIFVSVPSRRAMACVFIRKRQIFAAFL